MAEEAGLEPVQSRFESEEAYQLLAAYPNGRGVALRARSVLVRIQQRLPFCPHKKNEFRMQSAKYRIQKVVFPSKLCTLNSAL